MRALVLVLLLVNGRGDAGGARDAGVAQNAGVAGPRVYVQGSSINLRKEPTKDAEVLQKLQIGTECLVSERLEGGQWLKVRCGEVEGYASASLLGPEKPSAEKLKAEAMNPALPLAQREESALRAAMLAPEDAGLHEELGKLFFERNLDFVARLKKPLMRRPFSFSCSAEDAARCLNGTSSIYLNGIKVRVRTKNDAFVTALGVTDKVVVYRGKYRFNAKTGALTGEVLEQVEFPLTPVFEKALFSGVAVMQGDERDPVFGRYFLDQASLALLDEVPGTWALLTMQDARGPRFRWDSCARRPYQLQFRPDIHGRVLVYIENPDLGGLEMFWISSLSKRENTLDLTLEAFYGSRTRHELFKLPEPGEDIAYLGNTPYTSDLRRYPSISQPCVEGGP